MKKIVIPILFVLIFISLNCETTEPLDTTRLSISMVDVSVKEAYLKIHVKSPNPGETVELQRNGKTVMVFPSRSDTLIADTSLNENTTYSYRLILSHNSTKSSVSNDLSLTTLSPSSHNFTWKEFRLGDADIMSSFTDVLVLGDNDIWASGEIYFKDSLNGYHEDCYGAAHWDGSNWKFYKVMMHPEPYAPARTNPLFSIIQVNNHLYGLGYAGTVMFDSGRDVWYETTQFIKVGQNSYYDQMFKMWANDESSIYCVGRSGSVYIVNGKGYTAKKIRGDTEGWVTDNLDAWGVTDPMTDKLTILCALSNTSSYKGKILKITDTDKMTETPVEFAAGISTVWSNKGFPVYFGGGRSFYENSSGNWKEINLGQVVFLSRIRGNALNDFFAVGSPNVIAHYNGHDWKIFPEFNNTTYHSVHMKNNTVAVAGWSGNTGVILIGTR